MTSHQPDGRAADPSHLNQLFPSRQATWNEPGVLHTLRATPSAMGTYGGDEYFFFVNGHLAGALWVTSAVGEAVVDATTISVTYRVYNHLDAHCCPSGGQRTVRFHWNGSAVVPLDPAPGLTMN